MEQEVFKQQVLPLREQLLAYARRLTDNPDDAEDITQEVLLKLWCMRGELTDYKSIPALAVQMTKRLCLNNLKARQRKPANIETDGWALESRAASPYAALEQKDSLHQVTRIIDRLPGLQQTILRMKHIEGLEVEEIATLTGCNPEAVRMNLSRARKKVKELFFKINK
ncbi:MAG: sigma-70 family RNA polymerase sigma factor [Tannerella sp.]|jgi:RNA polymerase sigma-70 factor (ECF subfamily)|nr:sigma-70 family RNA polymerase sigma factor [Tannerella sp.]